ncbi:Bug family tripartite tricarboxylate transporter substrate binding protein [Rhodoplanes sp. Z2-YC6860]|uniref:Bug family tripartite tricarboxylate transporter substrate binding protein n=1 Tax=Rhodoplanes sp. Z2-YC6860 TaxID=674703 RepID=UPI00078B94B0|nr:tripartite tricarboxylate transporter substrate binding protein [Rhodoplanes sp. Z2-YC6860]AMN43926.1 extra-cytoplasmic solute receptor protein [Rhodoplanes sp. Z2-YC6860]
MLSVGRLALLLSALAVLGETASVSLADDWPSRPVTVIVPFGAGGNTDMMARLGAQHLTAKFGQTFVIENRPSAGGAVGSAQVSSAAPDGYTLMFAAASVVVLTPQVQKLSFDPGKQLVPLSNIGTGTQMIAIRRELPVRTLPEFIAYAKANPGKLNFTVAGTQNISHLAPVLLFAQAGINLVMVPQKSEPQAISDLIAGQVDLYFGNSSSLLPHIDSDKIRLIAVGTPQRIAAAPDIPTVAETIAGFQFSSWNGFFAPAATPEPIAVALRKEISSFARSPDIAAKLSKLGIVRGGLSLEESVAALKQERDAYAAALKVAGIAPAN